jgi:hypothetical protein
MVLYFTTCNKKLFDVSCAKLINSFIKFSNETDILYVFHENVNNLIDHIRVVYVNVENCEAYVSWFNKYKHVIPKKYGGDADPNQDTRLQFGFSVKWNQKTCLWFWKIIALKLILNYVTQDVIYWVFLDCDTRFVSKIEECFYEKHFHCAFHYHLGKYRGKIDNSRCAGIESGILVFKNTNATFSFLTDLFDTFESGEFMNYIRWDDGYVLRMIAKKPIHSLHCVDMVPKAKIKNVITIGPFANKIVHDIGKHHRLKLDQ